MNLFSNKQPPVDLDRLREEIEEHQDATHYAPPQVREVRESLPPSALQVIAHAITKLTWKDAEKMGEAIKEKIQDKTTCADITSAIQSWAEGWESIV